MIRECLGGVHQYRIKQTFWDNGLGRIPGTEMYVHAFFNQLDAIALDNDKWIWCWQHSYSSKVETKLAELDVYRTLFSSDRFICQNYQF